MFYRSLILCVVLIASASASQVFAGDDAPAWLRQAAAVKAPAYDKEVPAVVLHNEQTITVNSDGKTSKTTTYAVRILSREGRAYAEARETYLTGAGKVNEIRAWLILPNGEVKKYGKESVFDIISDVNDIYNEYRLKHISAEDDADAGMVFGYQSESEEQPLFGQDVWWFQENLPTLFSRYTLQLPNGWRASSITFNHANVEPSKSGTSYTGELRNLPPIEPEPASPTITNLAPRLAVNYYPEEGTRQPRARTFES